MNRRFRTKPALWLGLLALLLLAGVAMQRLAYATPEAAKAYHKAVAGAVEAVPETVGPWVGSESPVPRAAVQLLRPNVILSRSYHHPETGQRISLMIVHCRRARDLAGHYPPNCYPANGWEKESVSYHAWQVMGDRLPLAEYVFERNMATRSARMRILNTLILPGGELTPEMSQVRRAAADYQRRVYGAGQLQVIFHEPTPAKQRRQIFERFYRAMRPAIQEMRSGIPS